jgi:hypothetical protein
MDTGFNFTLGVTENKNDDAELEPINNENVPLREIAHFNQEQREEYSQH